MRAKRMSVRKVIDQHKVSLYKTPMGHVTITTEVLEKPEGPVLSLTGTIVCGWGQVQHELRRGFKNDPDMQLLCDIWDRWHLNDMHAGCIHQRAFEKEPYEKHRGAHCDICNYTYGTAWLYEPLPTGLIDKIKELMDKLEKKYDWLEEDL